MDDRTDEHDDVAYGRNVLQAEIAAIRDMVPLLDARFSQAVDLLLSCKGRVVVTGVGKSGLIGQKISATLASTGTPSLFLHSGEAVHGDLGRVLREDVVLALSYSGSTEEVIRLVPILKKIGAALIAVTCSAGTPLAQVADVALPVGTVEEACPVGLAPTSSTTAMLAMGDALAMAVARRRKFNREDFALFHPGGSIGRMLVTVGEVMRDATHTAIVLESTSVIDAIREMSRPGRMRAGAVVVVDGTGHLAGIFTDGDLRRRVVEDVHVVQGPISAVMTRGPKAARRDELLADAYKRFKEHQIDEMPVVDQGGRVVGLLDVQDVVEWGVALG